MNKIKKFICIGLITIMCFCMTGCAGCDRTLKSMGSDFTGGLNRTVKVYDYNGNLLATYEGKIDIEENESKVFFDLDGKRIVIYNAIVITEEK